MKNIKIKIFESKALPCGHTVDEGCGCGPDPKPMPNVHNGEESRMHRTSLAHLLVDTEEMLDLVQDSDDLPEWLETKITKAADYINSSLRYLRGNYARDMGALEESIIKEDICEVNDYFNLYEALQNAIDENGETPCPQCLYETIVEADCGCPDMLEEAIYQGKKVKIGKPTRNKKGSSKSKFSVYVKGCAKDKSRVTKISFGDPNMKIKKSNPKRRKSFRARHKCATAKDRCTARYWSCKKW